MISRVRRKYDANIGKEFEMTNFSEEIFFARPARGRGWQRGELKLRA